MYSRIFLIAVHKIYVKLNLEHKHPLTTARLVIVQDLCGLQNKWCYSECICMCDKKAHLKKKLNALQNSNFSNINNFLIIVISNYIYVFNSQNIVILERLFQRFANMKI